MSNKKIQLSDFIETTRPTELTQNIGDLGESNLVLAKHSRSPNFEAAFPHLISRLDLYGVLPVLGNKSDNEFNLAQVVQNTQQLINTFSDFENTEVVSLAKRLFTEASAFLAKTLEVPLPKQLRNDIDKMSSLSDIVKFLKKAQSFGKNPYGPLVCVVLKLSEALSDIDSTPELSNLIEKSEELEKTLTSAQFVHQEINGIMSISGKETSFRAKRIHIGTKSRERILNKLIRKVDVRVEDIIKDGVRAKIIIEDNHDADDQKKRIQQWLEHDLNEYGFELKDNKKRKNKSRDIKRQDLVMVGNVPGTNTGVEIQLVTESEDFKNEVGARNHEIYEWIQNFQVIARLFGSVSKKQFESKIAALSRKRFKNPEGGTYSVSEEELKRLFSSQFYYNPETRRYHWFEYDFRTNRTGVFSEAYQEKRNQGTFRAIQDRAQSSVKKREFFERMSLADWRQIITTNTFPDGFANPTEFESIIRFLKSIKGIPSLITLSLEIQLEGLNKNKPDTLGFADWQYIFRNNDFPPNSSIEVRNRAIDTLEKKDEEAFSFLLRLLKTKIEVENNIAAQ